MRGCEAARQPCPRSSSDNIGLRSHFEADHTRYDYITLTYFPSTSLFPNKRREGKQVLQVSAAVHIYAV